MLPEDAHEEVRPRDDLRRDQYSSCAFPTAVDSLFATAVAEDQGVLVCFDELMYEPYADNSRGVNFHVVDSVFLMMLTLFEGLAFMADTVGIPVRRISEMDIVLAGTSLKFLTTPADLVHIPSATERDALFKADVHSLGAVILNYIEHVEAELARSRQYSYLVINEGVFREMKTLAFAMTDADTDARPSASECVHLFGAAVGMSPHDAGWTRVGSGTYGCVGLDTAADTATKLFKQDLGNVLNTRDLHAYKEVAQTSAVARADPHSLFTFPLKTSEAVVLDTARFPAHEIAGCAWQHTPKHATAMRVAAAHGFFNSITDVAAFAASLERLFLGLVLLRQAKLSHHDIKPTNVMMHAPSGFYKFIDFGLSGATVYHRNIATRSPVTYCVWAPEQLVYAFGARHHKLKPVLRKYFEATALAYSLDHPGGSQIVVHNTCQAVLGYGWLVHEDDRWRTWAATPGSGGAMQRVPATENIIEGAEELLRRHGSSVMASNLANATKPFQTVSGDMEADIMSLDDVYALGMLVAVELCNEPLYHQAGTSLFKDLLQLCRDMIDLSASARVSAEEANRRYRGLRDKHGLGTGGSSVGVSGAGGVGVGGAGAGVGVGGVGVGGAGVGVSSVGPGPLSHDGGSVGGGRGSAGEVKHKRESAE